MADNGETKRCTNCKREISISNFTTHEIHCKRHISLCEHCGEPVPKGEMEIHFEEMHAKIKCPKCGIEVEKNQFEDHEENVCPKRPMKCLYCELEFPKSELDNHLDYCGSRTEPCVKCGQYIMLKDQIKHEESNCTYPPAPVKLSNGFNAGSGVGFRSNPVFSERENPTHPLAGFRNKRTVTNDLSSRASQENSKTIANKKSDLNRQRELASQSSQEEERDRLLAMHLQQEFSDSDGDVHGLFHSMEKSEPFFPPYLPGFNHSSSDNLNIFSEDMSLIPCEFCGQPYPADDLVLHQSACGHDMIGPLVAHAADDDHSNNRHDNRTEHMPSSPRQQPTIIDNLGRFRTDELYPEFEPISIDNTEVVATDLYMLPCEFCDELFPGDMLVNHQAVCDKNVTSTPRATTPATRTTQPKKKLSSISASMYDIPNIRSHRHQPPPHLQLQEDSTEDQNKSRSFRNRMSSNAVNIGGASGGTGGNNSSFGTKYGVKSERQDSDHGSTYQQRGSFSKQNSDFDRESTRNVQASIRKSGSDARTRTTLESLLKESSDTQNTYDLLGHVSSGRKNQKNDMNSQQQKNAPQGARGTSNPKPTANARDVKRDREPDRSGSRTTPGTQSRTSRSSGTQPDDGDGPNSRPQRNRVNNMFSYNGNLAAQTNKRPSGKRPDAPR